MLLSLERSSAVASAAVLGADGRPLASVERREPGRGDAWPLVREALDRAGASAADLGAFAVEGKNLAKNISNDQSVCIRVVRHDF